MSGGRAHLDRGSLAGARCWRYPHVFSFVYAGLINPFFYVTTVRTMGSRSRTRQATTGIRADRSANRAASGHRERRRRGCGMEPPHHRRRSSRGCRRGERNSKRSEPLGRAREEGQVAGPLGCPYGKGIGAVVVLGYRFWHDTTAIRTLCVLSVSLHDNAWP
jgi:hypothetical protein